MKFGPHNPARGHGVGLGSYSLMFFGRTTIYLVGIEPGGPVRSRKFNHT